MMLPEAAIKQFVAKCQTALLVAVFSFVGVYNFGVSTPFINNHKQSDNSPIKIGIARYINAGFAKPFERNIVKLFMRYPKPEMI